MGARLVPPQDQSGAPGRGCSRAGLPAGRSLVHPGKGGGCPACAAGSGGSSACSARGCPAPAPWSPRAACFPPWWSWAMSSPWPPCGTGAGGAGGRGMSKVSATGSSLPGTAAGHRPCQGGWRRGRPRGPPPSPLHFLVPSPSSPWSPAAARGQPLPRADPELPGSIPLEPHPGQPGGGEAGVGAGRGTWAVPGCSLWKQGPSPAARDGVISGDCQHRSCS